MINAIQIRYNQIYQSPLYSMYKCVYEAFIIIKIDIYILVTTLHKPLAQIKNQTILSWPLVRYLPWCFIKLQKNRPVKKNNLA